MLNTTSTSTRNPGIKSLNSSKFSNSVSSLTKICNIEPTNVKNINSKSLSCISALISTSCSSSISDSVFPISLPRASEAKSSASSANSSVSSKFPNAKLCSAISSLAIASSSCS